MAGRYSKIFSRQKNAAKTFSYSTIISNLNILKYSKNAKTKKVITSKYSFLIQLKKTIWKN